MSRRYLAFVIGINAAISLMITLLALWLVELRRPDPEQLASIITPPPPVILAATAIPATTPVPQNAEAVQAPAPVPPTAAPRGDSYTVQAGDSLSNIATRFNVTINALLEANNLDNPDFVFVGQVLFLPPDAVEIQQPTSPASNNNGQTATGSSGEGDSNGDDSNSVESVGLQIAQIDGVGDLASEVAQIVNDSDAALNLQGWRISYDNGPVYTFGNFPIFPGGSVRLHSTTGTDSSIDLYWRQSEPVWQSQRVAQLIDDQGRLVAQYVIP